jgi:hypothetical protein
MAAHPEFCSPLLFLREHPEAVLTALRQGWVEAMDAASDQITDEHVLYALKSGLLGECAQRFPDPRLNPEVPLPVLLTASVAGAFQGEYALRESGCALHSPALLAQLGLNVAWLQPGEGVSRRGTAQAAVFHGDVLRKLLLQIAALDREAGRPPGASLLRWWNETVGPAFLRHAGGGTGAWIRDTTKLLVPLANDRYEASEVIQEEGKAPQRGYKLGLLSALIDTGRLLVGVAFDGLRCGDLPLTRALVQGEHGPLVAGDSLREDRGLLDGAEITVLKRDLGVDVIVPLKRDMLAFRLALARVEGRPHRWEAHPTRKKQEIQKISGIGAVWEECDVPLNGCVVREWNTQKQAYEYWVFATTDLGRSARGIIFDYEARSECEEDHRQIKGPDWELDEFTSTRLVEILYHVLIVLFAYNLCQLYGLTAAGQRFAGKTKRARQREERRRRQAQVVVVAGPYYAVFPWTVVAEELLTVEGAAKERLRALVQRQRAGAAGAA